MDDQVQLVLLVPEVMQDFPDARGKMGNLVIQVYLEHLEYRDLMEERDKRVSQVTPMVMYLVVLVNVDCLVNQGILVRKDKKVTEVVLAYLAHLAI